MARFYHSLALLTFLSLFGCSGGYEDPPEETEAVAFSELDIAPPEPQRMPRNEHPFLPIGYPRDLPHVASDPIRNPTGVRSAVATPNNQPLTNSVRLGNKAVIQGAPGGTNWGLPGYTVDLMNIDLATVDKSGGAADAFIHSPGSWVLSWRVSAADFAGVQRFGNLAMGIQIGAGGASTIIEVSVVPGGSIALPTSTVKAWLFWSREVDGQAGWTPPTNVTVEAFLQRSFTIGNAHRKFQITPTAAGASAASGVVPAESFDFGVYGLQAADVFLATTTLSLMDATSNLYQLTGAQLLTAMQTGQRFPLPSGVSRWSLSYAAPIVNSNPAIDFGVGF